MSRPLLEFGGGSGEILRDLLHLRSVSEAEALISGAEGRDHVKRNVKRWRGGQMMLRWVAAGVLEAAKGFRRLKGHADMPQLWRVLLMRLSAALVVASERWRRGERPSVSTVTVSSSPSRTLAAAQGCSMVETANERAAQAMLAYNPKNMTEDEREHLLSTVGQAHAGLSEVALKLRLGLPPKTPALKTAIKAERVAFDLKRSLQRLEVKDVETITRSAALLPEVRRGWKVVDPESLLRHENRHNKRLTGLPRRNTPRRSG